MKRLYILAAALLTAAGISSCSDGEGKPSWDYNKLAVNEVSAATDGGQWIEIYNRSTFELQLEGVAISAYGTDTDSRVLYTFPAGSTMAGGGFSVITVPASSPLDYGNIKIRIDAPDGSTPDTFDRNAAIGNGAEHPQGGSFSRIPDGEGTWMSVPGHTKNGFNTRFREPAYDGLRINEICSFTAGGDQWIELYNNSEKDIELSYIQIFIGENARNAGLSYVFPQGTHLKAEEFIVISKSDGQLTKGWTDSQTADFTIQLLSYYGNSVDIYNHRDNFMKGNLHATGQSYQLISGGSWHIAPSTKGVANQ